MEFKVRAEKFPRLNAVPSYLWIATFSKPSTSVTEFVLASITYNTWSVFSPVTCSSCYMHVACHFLHTDSMSALLLAWSAFFITKFSMHLKESP